MLSPVLFIALCAISGVAIASKYSPRPGLKTFRSDYATVVKTCEAVGFVKDKCNGSRGKAIGNSQYNFDLLV
jgi:hypothetical protein